MNNDNICNLYNTSAVYELISISKVDYNYSQSTTIYIGSTKNLYKRLNEYKNNKGHSLKMRNYLEDNLLYFRFIKTDNYQHLETILLHEFISLYGEMPLLNINNSKK